MLLDYKAFKEVIVDLNLNLQKLQKVVGSDKPIILDGIVVGRIGEAFACHVYDLQPKKQSNKGFDALSKEGIHVEIKTTQKDSIAFRSIPEHCIALKLYSDGRIQELYNGPGSLIWEGRDRPKGDGTQTAIRISHLKKCQEKVTNPLPIAHPVD